MVNHLPVILSIVGAAAGLFALFTGRDGAWGSAFAMMVPAAAASVRTGRAGGEIAHPRSPAEGGPAGRADAPGGLASLTPGSSSAFS